MLGLGLCVGAPARAVTVFDLGSPPDAPLSSGGLHFSNFRFESVFGDIAAEDIVATIDGPSLTLAGRDGPIAVSDGDHALFVVSYDVAAGSFAIEGVSLFLDSHTEADRFAAVLAEKAVFGERLHDPHPDPWRKHHHGGRGGSDDSRNWDTWNGWERDDDKERGSHGRGDEDRDDEDRDDDDRGRPLAKLSTFDVSKHGRSGASRLAEAAFEPQEAIRVVDAVLLEAWDEDDLAVWNSLRNDFALVPEPGSAALLGLGLLGLARAGRARTSRRIPSSGIGSAGSLRPKARDVERVIVVVSDGTPC